MKHAIAFVVVSVSLLIVYFSYPNHRDFQKMTQANTDIYAPPESARKLYQIESDPSGTNSALINALYERLSPAFDKRFEQYKSNLDALRYNLWCQLIFIVAAFVVILEKANVFKIPIIEKEVQMRWVYLAIPVCLVYLWISFGFLINQLIDARIMLWKITETLSPPGNFSNELEWYKAIKTFSPLPAANDGWFLDGWFTAFETKYTIFAKPQIVSTVLMILFGVFFGISNGMGLGLILHGRKRFATSKVQQWVYAVYFWGMAILLGICHCAFWHEGIHPNFQQIIMLPIICILVWILARVRSGKNSTRT